ncbi:MAG: hypothetical protein AB7M12_11265 [Hyphomonadaceae bacterium]
MLRALASAACLIACATTPARADRFSLEYDGYALGLAPIGKVSFDITVGDGLYEAAAGMRAGGLLGLFQQQSIAAAARGQIVDGAPIWQSYLVDQQTEKKRRRTTLIAAPEGPAVTMEPAFKVWGDPPASTEQKRAGGDPLSAILKMSIDAQQQRACSGVYPVFDGRYYYLLSLAGGDVAQFDDGGYDGPILRCALIYEPIAGYDERQQRKRRMRTRNGEIWFALTGGSLVAPPVRVVFPTPAGRTELTLSAWRRFTVDVGEGAPGR